MSKSFFKNFILSALALSTYIHCDYKVKPYQAFNPLKDTFSTIKKMQEQEASVILHQPTQKKTELEKSALEMLPDDLIHSSEALKLPFDKNEAIDLSKNPLFTHANILLLQKYWKALLSKEKNKNRKIWESPKGEIITIKPSASNFIKIASMATFLKNKQLIDFISQHIAAFIINPKTSPTEALKLVMALPVEKFTDINNAVVEIVYANDPEKILSALNNALLLIEPKKMIGELNKVTSLHITPDGTKIILGVNSPSIIHPTSIENLARIFNVHADRFTKELKNATQTTITPDGKKIITALVKTLTVRDLDDPRLEQLTKIEIPYPQASGPINSLLTTSDSSKIVSRNEGNTVNIWDINTGAMKTIATPNLSIAITPNSEKLIAGGDGIINIFDINTATLIKTILKPGETITSLIAPADDEIIFGSHNGNITILNTTQNSSETVNIQESFPATFKSTMSMNAIIQIPLSPYIVFNRGPALIIMDTITKTFFPIGSPHNDIYPKEDIIAIATSPNSAQIISAGENGPVYNWDVSVLQNYKNSAYDIYKMIKSYYDNSRIPPIKPNLPALLRGQSSL
ncbi:MAG: hypothetical protein WC707_01170 [Candidatus Babeliaceae bacterium]|jgi:WD40 repeat protein